jgi:hypothetical protein
MININQRNADLITTLKLESNKAILYNQESTKSNKLKTMDKQELHAIHVHVCLSRKVNYVGLEVTNRSDFTLGMVSDN